MAQSLFQVLDFLSKLDELVGKLSYANDPVKAANPALKMRAKTLLKDFLKRWTGFFRAAAPRRASR